MLISGSAAAKQINPTLPTKNWVGGCSNAAGWHDVPGGGLPWWTYVSGCDLPTGNPLTYDGDLVHWSMGALSSGMYKVEVWIAHPDSANCGIVNSGNFVGSQAYKFMRSGQSTLSTTLAQGSYLNSWKTLWSSVRLASGDNRVI